MDGGTWGMNLLPIIEGAQALLLIDAINIDAAPGTPVTLPRSELPRRLAIKMSPHQVGYVGFIEELPQVTAQARTIDEARKALHDLAAVIFDAERQSARELLAGKDVVREAFVIPFARRTAADRRPMS